MLFFSRPLAATLLLVLSIQSAPAIASDLLVEARLAAIDGNHRRCADLADQARNQSGANWQAHNIYASCLALDAEKQKPDIGAEHYKAQILKAIRVFEELATGELELLSRNRMRFAQMAIELRKRLKSE